MTAVTSPTLNRVADILAVRTSGNTMEVLCTVKYFPGQDHVRQPDLNNQTPLMMHFDDPASCQVFCKVGSGELIPGTAYSDRDSHTVINFADDPVEKNTYCLDCQNPCPLALARDLTREQNPGSAELQRLLDRARVIHIAAGILCAGPLDPLK